MAIQKTIKAPLTVEMPKHEDARRKSISMTDIIAKPENLASMVSEVRGEKVLLERSQTVTALGAKGGNSSQSVMTGKAGEPLRSQTVISKEKGGRPCIPYAFTEQGVAMLSNVLHSQCAPL